MLPPRFSLVSVNHARATTRVERAVVDTRDRYCVHVHRTRSFRTKTNNLRYVSRREGFRRDFAFNLNTIWSCFYRSAKSRDRVPGGHTVRAKIERKHRFRHSIRFEKQTGVWASLLRLPSSRVIRFGAVGRHRPRSNPVSRDDCSTRERIEVGESFVKKSTPNTRSCRAIRSVWNVLEGRWRRVSRTTGGRGKNREWRSRERRRLVNVCRHGVEPKRACIGERGGCANGRRLARHVLGIRRANGCAKVPRVEHGQMRYNTYRAKRMVNRRLRVGRPVSY